MRDGGDVGVISRSESGRLHTGSMAAATAIAPTLAAKGGTG